MTDGGSVQPDSDETRDVSVSDTERCENCNAAPEDFEKGHSYTETEHGIEYDVEHLNDLGHLEANGISLLFDRMNNRLVIERVDQNAPSSTETAQDGDGDE